MTRQRARSSVICATFGRLLGSSDDLQVQLLNGITNVLCFVYYYNTFV